MHHTIIIYLSCCCLSGCVLPNGDGHNVADNKPSSGRIIPANGASVSSGNGLVNTDDPAIAVLEAGDARFRLHGLLEFRPQDQPGLSVNPEKKYLMADISIENIGDAPIYPAGYMLTANLIDQKGKSYGFANSVKTVALFDGNTSNKYSREESAGFTNEQFPPGAKARGFLYGFEVDRDVVFAKMNMRVNGELKSVEIKQ